MKNNNISYQIPQNHKEGTRFKQSGEQLDFHLSHLPYASTELGQEALQDSQNYQSPFSEDRRADFGRQVATISEVADRNEKNTVYEYMKRLGENLLQFRRMAQDGNPDTNQTLLSDDENPNYLNQIGAGDYEQVS